MAVINFHAESLHFKVPFPRKTSTWIEAAFRKEKKKLKELNYIFCSDKYLLGINQQYLNHTTFTDIITFDNGEEGEPIEGDIFISVERVKENATKFKVPFETELRRVIIHGALHLMGYGDKSPDARSIMRKKEDTYLSLFR